VGRLLNGNFLIFTVDLSVIDISFCGGGDGGIADEEKVGSRDVSFV
jgi:hypothetical protein